MDFTTRRYTGQLEDPETGLYYYNARYYNPVLGRFLSPDSSVPEPGTPQSLNRYSYVENNPVRWTDPGGHFIQVLLPMLVGILVGAAAYEGLMALGFAATTALIGAGMAGGAAAGAASSLVNGGNLAANMMLGAAFGGIGAAVGGPLYGALAGTCQGASNFPQGWASKIPQPSPVW